MFWLRFHFFFQHILRKNSAIALAPHVKTGLVQDFQIWSATSLLSFDEHYSRLDLIDADHVIGIVEFAHNVSPAATGSFGMKSTSYVNRKL